MSRAIEALRNAENGQKAVPLAALRAVPCSLPDICAVQSQCIAAYEEHLRALELIAATRASAPTASADSVKQALGEASAALARVRASTDACATKQGEMARKYRVAR